VQAPTFYEFRLSNIIEIATLIIGGLAFYFQRKGEILKIKQEREVAEKQQLEMHIENRNKLDFLIEYRTSQEKLNEKRDASLNLLTNLLATQTEMSKGLNRRLELVENIVHNRNLG
jgi:hypothetical protein